MLQSFMKWIELKYAVVYQHYSIPLLTTDFTVVFECLEAGLPCEIVVTKGMYFR